MLTLKYIRDNKDEVIERLKIKNFNAESHVGQIISLDDTRRQTQVELDNALSRSKTLAKEIGQLFKNGKVEEANKIKDETGKLKEDSKTLQTRLNTIESEINKLLVEIPNLPHSSVPEGNSEEDNLVVREGGNTPELKKGNLPHWELSKKLQIIDFELGNKLTGAGFPVYKGKGAKLQRALISFFLDEAEKAGFEEVLPPFMVNEDSGFGTGQLPDKDGQMYHVQIDNFYLIPTAEVPVTNMYRDVILQSDQFPVKNTAYTPCFRREAGSYGKDVRGLNRLHQFDKVEIVVIEHPDRSYQMLEQMVKHVEMLINKLGLKYRILKLCGGDISFTSALTYDFEVFSAAQEKWLEVSSVSNFESFQANRLKLRFKEEGDKKTQLAHTLNGSALALPRIVAALIENYQQGESVRVPEILIPYTGFDVID